MFNIESRTRNSAKSSISAATYKITNTVFAFVYRTVFLFFLGKEYLGINGLFTNILQLFSLVDLGLDTVISYRLYKPIAEENLDRVSAYMGFYKYIYRCIFILITVIGCAFAPFLESVVNFSEIPTDVNPYVIYLLFVFQSATSYLYTYKQTLINADQKAYISSTVHMGASFATYMLRIVILITTHNYTLVLASGIVLQMLVNYVYSVYITRKYKDVFACKSCLTKNEIILIFKDTFAGACHRIGGGIISGTDNIILSKFVSLAAVGVYSNYSLILTSITSVLHGVFSGITGSIGNYNASKTVEENEQLYLKMHFLNLWISWFCTIALGCLINPFIEIWQDESFLFSNFVVISLCIKFYLQSTCMINSVFINATGLFNRDKLRPFIEAGINLVASVVLVINYGIVGIFVGTIVSNVTTQFWRQYYLLFKYIFKMSPKKVLGQILVFTLGGLLSVYLITSIMSLFDNIFARFVLGGVCCCIIPNAVYIIALGRTEEYLYIKNKAFSMIFCR